MTNRESPTATRRGLISRARASLERLRCDDEVVDRHDATGELRGEIVEVTVVGENQSIGRHGCRRRGTHRDATGVVEASAARIFVDAHAEFDAAPGDTEREIERMQMRRVPVDVAAVVGVGTEQVADLPGVEFFDSLTTVSSREFVRERMILGDVARLVRDRRDARRQIAVDRELRDQSLDQTLRVFAELPQTARFGRPESRLEPIDVLALAAVELPAVSSRTRPSRCVGTRAPLRSCPPRARCSAVDKPVNPAPTMHTSAS